MTIKVLLAEDHKIIRQGLRSLLANEADIEVIAEAENGHQAIELTGELSPDVVVMDITMPGLNGMEATSRITKKFSNIKVIALSMHSDSMFVSKMLKSGASGYLLKDCAFDELAEAIRAVVCNKIYLSPVISGVVINDYLHLPSSISTAKPNELTAVERQVLQLLVDGKSVKKISQQLNITEKDVDGNRQRIMDKLGIKTMAALTKYAIRKGITSLKI